MKFTKEQLDAINLSGKNIIVSAGAGSGKTTVLTDRIIKKLESGVNINELLVLTFTNLAASEMKDRVRKKMLGNELVVSQKDLLDSAYITTFDSYCLSIVKKYHYLLNIPKNISIVDTSLLNIKKRELLSNVFLKYYENPTDKFNKLIDNYCNKDDETLKTNLLSIIEKMSLIKDLDNYLDNYIEEYFNSKKIEDDINNYNELCLDYKKEIINTYYDLISLCSEKEKIELEKAFNDLINSSDYLSIKNSLNFTFPRTKNSCDEIVIVKDKIKKQIKELSNIAIYNSIDDIKEQINSMKDIVEIIIEIIKEYNNELMIFKNNNYTYEFNDIELMAIKILEDNKETKERIKNSFKEILIDEYQDTNDLQEYFISLIENNNVYMVGDIKQSIYGFRNANPSIFMNKYDLYKKNLGGIKIDLNKNFRSRESVIEDINRIFNELMTTDVGGANYKLEHQLIYGNIEYTDIENQNNNIDVLCYSNNDNYLKDEIEASIIAEDINNKINNKYQVYSKENKKRDIEYSDITILFDRGTSFNLFKQILEYNKIPVNLYRVIDIKEEMEIFTLKNILEIISLDSDNVFDEDFKMLFVSIKRSFLYNMSDKDIANIFATNSIKTDETYFLIHSISESLDSLTPIEVVEIVLDRFNFYEKIITTQDIESRIIRLDYLKEIIVNLSNMNYDIKDIVLNLKEIFASEKLEIKLNNDDNPGVKLMTIHGSKGLEFPVVYYPGLYRNFNFKDLTNKYIFNNNYGIIFPVNDSNTIYHELYKKYALGELISEKLRLLYVALTRSKEKIILLDNIDISSKENIKISSYLDFLSNINLNKISVNPKLTKEYKMINNKNYSDYINEDNSFNEVLELELDDSNQELLRYSKNELDVINEEDYQKLKFGEYLHYVLEITDLKNGLDIDIEDYYKTRIKSFISKLGDLTNTHIYKEYEFMSTINDSITHGIIDLMIEYDDQIKIIDYKLKGLTDENYLRQLNGYKDYISSISNKEVSIYLYSIIDDKLEEIKRSSK